MKVLKFGASWCPDCKMMEPLWKEIEKKHSWLETEYIGIDKHPEAINQYKILSVPTFLFLDKEENEILRLSGKIAKDILIKTILENKDK